MEDELRGLVDSEFWSIIKISKEDFWQWASGLMDDLTRDVCDKVHDELS